MLLRHSYAERHLVCLLKEKGKVLSVDSTSIRSFSACAAIRAQRSCSSMSEAHCNPFEYLILASPGAHARTGWLSAGRDSPKSVFAHPPELEPATALLAPHICIPFFQESSILIHLCRSCYCSAPFLHAGGL